jgi:hypothetical protein
MSKPNPEAELRPDLLPEYAALIAIEWQLFITLTFKCLNPQLNRCKPIAKAFLAELAAVRPSSHFKELLWVLRWERRLPDGRGHFHACVAGLDPSKLTEEFCARAVAWWSKRTGARAEVKIYVKALDGLAYVLKRLKTPAAQCHWQATELTAEFDQLQPTLSESIFRLLRKTR